MKKLGIQENHTQFMLLVIINLFVGSMVGLERTIMPLLGEETFGVKSSAAALSFIVSFGFSKAIVNYFAGYISDRFGRKRVLQVGWFVGLLVPLFIIFAPNWETIIVANILLGINQGLAWSMTVNMKIDLAKGSERGTAVGLNEFAGYSGVAIFALLSGYVASHYAVTPQPFYLGLGIAVIGVGLSFVVKDTKEHVTLHLTAANVTTQRAKSAKEVFSLTTWRNKELSAFTFAGLATNFKDGMVWGLLPVFLFAKGLSLGEIGVIVAVYPAAWGIVQLATGTWSDRVGRKGLLVGGMITQAVAIGLLLVVNTFVLWLLAAGILGVGTAMVYPVLQAAIGDVASPDWRASAMGVYRFWRDSGYAFGALLAGVLADLLNVTWAIGLVALLPAVAAINLAFRSNETRANTNS
ncbi:MFS transporter [Paenisporosarcina cavernae]|uniref:MFS transporter n=1 Tax=Paenisporosarcina cavernae TaxID=2320858 RepID=A0A385YPA8_9BACL|nr:MFS transporter [Paenisporosarcina cavernae]AYC28529.1 MFS transporter [Paenisporosarcina cavernae]